MKLKTLNKWAKKYKRPYKKLLRKFKSKEFERRYVVFSVITLLLSTAYWALITADVHISNADQLVNAYMFESRSVFDGAIFPSQHTYLLKWPIFWVVELLGNSNNIYSLVTLMVTILTVGVFVKIIHKIEPRPLYFGTIVLMIASTLMLVPIQPSAGMLLPINIAMIANRNLEYVLYILALFALVKARDVKDKYALIAFTLLVILIASDRLFMSLSLAGSLVALIFFIIIKKPGYSMPMAKWLTLSIFSTVSALILIKLISALSITNVSSDTISLYGASRTVSGMALGVFYAITGLLSNFGANPSYMTTIIKDMPSSVVQSIFSLSILTVLTNLFIFMICMFATFKTSLYLIGKLKIRRFSKDKTFIVSAMLIFTSLATLAAFILTNHYYAGDARYLSIIYFCSFITLAIYSRTVKIKPEKLVLFGSIIFIGILLSSFYISDTSKQYIQGGNEFKERNLTIESIINNHKVGTLIGDYWRVIPIRQLTEGKQSVTPLSDCVTFRNLLSSYKWQPDLNYTSFAYILTMDKTQTDVKPCTLEEVTTVYGKPNMTVLVAGSIDNPKELLLFYDHGISKNSRSISDPTVPKPTTAPVNLNTLNNKGCDNGTVMNIVAHQDDDILFINPDTHRSIKEGKCVRTLYMTAGDAGFNQYYWLDREQGSQSAYNTMLGYDSLWFQRTVKLANKQYISITSPKKNSKITQLYLRLPDGNIQGHGFRASNYESLKKLNNGEIINIQSVYGESVFTRNEIVEALAKLMNVYKPTEIRTQSTQVSHDFHDHSDHEVVSILTNEAFELYVSKLGDDQIKPSFSRYLGYQIQQLEPNLSTEDFNNKVDAFMSYGKHDNGVCHDIFKCMHGSSYGRYLERQYIQE